MVKMRNVEAKKIRVGDKISLPDQDLIIIIVEPSQEEKEQFAEEMAEKTRVAALVKQMNQANKRLLLNITIVNLLPKITKSN